MQIIGHAVIAFLSEHDVIILIDLVVFALMTFAVSKLL